jgi:RNA polymerase sigma factor (sigma-70 family)
MDEKTLLQLYRTCYPDIARYIMNRGGTADQAEEAFHAALGAMLQQLDKGAVVNDYGAYLFRSAWNSFLAEKRQGSRYEKHENIAQYETSGEETEPMDEISTAQGPPGFREPIETGPGPDQHADQQLLLDAAEASIGELSKAQQTILQLSFDPELNLDDDGIAVRLGVTRDYVRVARFRAMEALRTRMYRRGYGYMM